MQVQIYANSQLLSDDDEMQALQLGAVDMLAPSLSKFGRLGFPEFELFDLPFLFQDAAQVHRVMQGRVGQALLAGLQRQRLVGLGYLDNGFKHMSANRPLLEPQDFVGQRLRVQSSRVIAHQMRALGRSRWCSILDKRGVPWPWGWWMARKTRSLISGRSACTKRKPMSA